MNGPGPRYHGSRPQWAWIAVAGLLAGCSHVQAARPAKIGGQLRQWHTITLTFDGPATSEQDTPNPFLDYRLDVRFTNGERVYVVPGYYAADGNAAQTGASSGNKWRVHFVPDQAGRWTYLASFRRGPMVAIADSPTAGRPCWFDGASGTFEVLPTDKQPPDLRAKGILRYVGKRYLQFAHTGQFFIKAGTDSPENLLAFADFDGTYDTAGLGREGEAKGDLFVHRYLPHLTDWKTGDPVWQGDKGKGLIGALNYLASKGVNSAYLLTYNIDGGDGKDVWPWTSPTERFRFDCSKLDQWEIVFGHMERLGMMLHIVTQETENDQALDGGELGPQRRSYYRELIARFAHHLALVWNLGEENTNTDQQRKAFADLIRKLDPYDHPIVCHTFPGQYDQVYATLLGWPCLEGASLQTNDTHLQTKRWIQRSEAAGRSWFVCLDEIGPASTGVMPDVNDPNHDQVRTQHLWANLMAGGAGVEWYFGYNFAHNDLNCEDFRSRDRMWDMTRQALGLMRQLPFDRMSSHDELTTDPNDYCLAWPGQVYCVYLPKGGTTELDLGDCTGSFEIRWFDPRSGGPMQPGTVKTVKGPGRVQIGHPPYEGTKDWAAVVRLIH